jgi:hypothetical protein
MASERKATQSDELFTHYKYCNVASCRVVRPIALICVSHSTETSAEVKKI